MFDRRDNCRLCGTWRSAPFGIWRGEVTFCGGARLGVIMLRRIPVYAVLA